MSILVNKMNLAKLLKIKLHVFDFLTMTIDHDYDRFHINLSGHSHCHKS